MKFEIDTAKMYTLLTEGRAGSAEAEFFQEAIKQMRSGNEWKNERERSPQRKIFQGQNIILPGYARIGGLSVTKNEDEASSIRFWYQPEKIIGVSDVLGKTYGPRWIDIGNESGYILDDEGEIYIAVSQRIGSEVSMGHEHGTSKVLLGDFEEFVERVSGLERVVNLVMNAYIEKSVQDEILTANPPIRLYLTI